MFEILMCGNHDTGGLTTAVGQKLITTTSTFTIPLNVFEVCIVAVGEGEAGYNAKGGNGGDLRWRNNLNVKPGDTLSVTTGVNTATGKGLSTSVMLNGTTVLVAKSGGGLETSTSMNGSTVGGGNGGLGTSSSSTYGGCGGGAGGYAGNGGNGAVAGAGSGSNGSGGGGGGGANYYYNYWWGSLGGAVGLLGQGNDGAAGKYQSSVSATASGQPGSGGTAATAGPNGANAKYGAGSGCAAPGQSTVYKGGPGACRIIWGPGRKFPSTLTADQPTSS